MEGFGELGWVEYYQLLLFSFNDNINCCKIINPANSDYKSESAGFQLQKYYG